MKNSFFEKVIKEGMVDTRNYRYITTTKSDFDHQWLAIERLPIDKLDTTAALHDWETVYTSDKYPAEPGV